MLNGKKPFTIPNTYALIMIFIIIATIATYIIPSGEYGSIVDEYGKEVVNPNDFQLIKQSPIGIGKFLTAIPQGMNSGADVIFLVFLVGAFFQIINDTKAIDIWINTIIKKLDKYAFLVIPIIMVIMSILGAMGIVVSAIVAFIPIGIALAKKMKLDPVAGVGIMYLAAYAGFTSSPMSPYTTIIGQTIAGLAPFSGFVYRTIVMVVVTIATIIYVYRYSYKVSKNNKHSIYDTIVWEDEFAPEIQSDRLELPHIIVLLSLLIGFTIYGYGCYKLSWGLNQLSGMMLAVALISGIVMKMSPNEMAKSFIKGAQDMVYGALIIGFAGAITIILTEGKIIHSIIYYMTIPLTRVSNILSANWMFLINLIFNFFVPSGSGQAYIVMPLMAPMADLIGVSRQIAVSAYQYGDGFSNIIVPTSGILMAVLGVAKVPFEKWIKFVMPLFLIWTAIGFVAITIACLIGYA